MKYEEKLLTRKNARIDLLNAIILFFGRLKEVGDSNAEILEEMEYEVSIAAAKAAGKKVGAK